jgi:excisionase family DNA binding protein
MDDISVAEAAEILGVSARRVRALLESGQLRGRRVGGRWLLSVRDVEQRQRGSHGGGRPLSSASAWHMLAMLSGAEDSLSELPAPARSRARSRARDICGPGEIEDKWPHVLANRAHLVNYYGHPSVLAALLVDSRVVRSGVSAAADHNADLIVMGQAEGYIRSSDAQDLRAKYALNADVDHAQANVVLHIVDDERAAQWLFNHPVAPAAVVAADLAERATPRDHAAGMNLAANL